jgi:hypothetical protein
MGTTSNYRGDAREFSEGDEHFELMFKRAIDFLDYTALWGGFGGLTPENIEELSDQQSKLGLARAMAIAIEKNPLPEKYNGNDVSDDIPDRKPLS